MTEQPVILYIEDNPDNQRLIQRILTTRGYSVLIARDGPAGLALARETQPMLVLVDLNIPGLDGYETTTRLRSLPHLQTTPIVALTADNRSSAREHALVAGCDGYISKPIDVRRLPGQITEFIGGKREFVPPVVETAVLREYNHKLVERLEQRVRELSTANAELQELDRIKSQFLSTLSHELRTPLTSLLGYLELFLRGTLGPLNDTQHEAVALMRRNAEVLSRHLNNLLYLQEARSTSLNLTSVYLPELVQQVVDAIQGQIQQRNVQLDLLITEVAPLQADAKALQLVVQNLLDNALKFTPAGGQIVLSVADEPSRVLLRVADTGCGIPEEAIEKIFLPFYQIDNSLARPYPGNGLGLAIVRHIVEAHAGQITARSVPGQGTIFTVMLPRTPATSETTNGAGISV
ncbi:MAG: ATP-binding protein [Chloroflexaceae bacterium]